MKYLLLALSIFIACSFNSKEFIGESLQNVQMHIDQKIEEAEVVALPFPHIVIEEIFPDALYAKIHELWPHQREFVGHKRKILPITYGCIESTTLNREQKIFWRIFGEVIVNRYIKSKLTEKLASYANLKYGFENDEHFQFNYPTDFINMRQDCLMEDFGDYFISPHIDQLNIFAALLFYLPVDCDHQNFGTQFLSADKATSPNVIHEHKEFVFEKMIPYRPNTLVCFLQTPFSWHKVDPIDDESYIRKMYAAPIFLSPEFMEKKYNQIPSDTYFFDHRFLNRSNWWDIWSSQDYYK